MIFLPDYVCKVNYRVARYTDYAILIERMKQVFKILFGIDNFCSYEPKKQWNADVEKIETAIGEVE